MIRLVNVSKHYQYGLENNLFYALKDINLEIRKSEFISIIGKSGSGKSTLMNIIGSLDRPSSGELYIDGINIQKMSLMEQNIFRNEKIGFVFQSFYLEPSYTVFQNVEIPLLIKGVSRKERKIRVEEQLNQVGLISKANLASKFLSGGEQQRVCIARAMINNPSIILADEPCGHLDTQNSKVILELLCKFRDKKTTVLLITHNQEEANLADRIIEMQDGNIIADYTKYSPL